MIETENTASTPFDQNLPHLGNVEDITPHPKSQTYIVFGLVLFLLLTAGAAAFMFSQNQSLKSQIGLPTFRLPWTQVTCTQEGQVYKAGESVPSSDGCNTCACDESGQVACTLMACIDEDEQVQADPTADWETYSNEQETLKFKYPSTLIVEENPDYLGDRMQIYIKDSQKIESFSIDIWADYPPGQSQYFMDTGPTSQETIGNVTWDTYYLPCGYRDGINNSPCIPTYALQSVINDVLFSLTFSNQKSITEIQAQILSTFEFTDSEPSSNQNEIKTLTLSGTLEELERPAPDTGYDYQLKLDAPYFDELNAQGPTNIASIVVVPANEAIRQTLASNIGNSVSIEGVIEWGLAETRHLKATKIVVMPDN